MAMVERVGSDGEADHPHRPDLSAPANVLVQAPSIGAARDDACYGLLGRTPPESTELLVVTFTRSPAGWAAEWTDRVGRRPVRGTVLSIGDRPAGVEHPAWTVETVENPADLTGVGVRLSDALSTLAAGADEDHTVAVCFDSVTSLLQYAGLQRAFRFLHAVTGRVQAAGGVGHYHVDPAAHDSQEMATLGGLFDAVVEADEGGGLAVRR